MNPRGKLTMVTESVNLVRGPKSAGVPREHRELNLHSDDPEVDSEMGQAVESLDVSL